MYLEKEFEEKNSNIFLQQYIHVYISYNVNVNVCNIILFTLRQMCPVTMYIYRCKLNHFEEKNIYIYANFISYNHSEPNAQVHVCSHICCPYPPANISFTYACILTSILDIRANPCCPGGVTLISSLLGQLQAAKGR